jgi:divalent metal cation (Fe/Co/Zn/Cd) transporter
MKGAGTKATIFGIATNFLLFLTKLYIGISSNSLPIYCDAINNLGDTFACIIGLLGFFLIKKLNETKSLRAQSLCTFVISLIIAVSGIYFVYNGIERTMYPLPINYTHKYVYAIAVTIGVKIIMGIVYIFFNKKQKSSVLSALVLDSFLDCFITAFALMSLVLVTKINFAADGIFAIVTGLIITVSAVKNVINESKFLINN